MIIKFDNLSEEEFLHKYFELINALSPEDKKMAHSEMQLLTEFLLLPEDKFKYQRFGTLAKNKVIANAALKGWTLSRINVNNKLYSLIEKGFLRRDDDKVLYIAKYILNALYAFRTNNKLDIELHFNGKKDTSVNT